jgi:hypothetical protein
MLLARRHWPPVDRQGLGRRRGGSPESEDLPFAAAIEPLAEGGFVLRRPSVLVLAILVALLVAPVALATLVHVRVEGKTQTLFGATEPKATGSTPLQALESASLAGELYYHVATLSFGPYVDQVGRYGGSATSGWVFKVNGVSPPVGADQVQLADGDTVLWYYATFGPAGGPPTLTLKRAGKGCYSVVAQDDAGKPVGVASVLAVDGKRFPTSGGKACVGAHRGLVHATAPGTIRSNALA